MDYIAQVDQSVSESHLSAAIKNATADGLLGTLPVDPNSGYLVYGVCFTYQPLAGNH